MKKSVKLLSLFAMLAGFSTVAAAEGVFVGGSLDAQASKLKASSCESPNGYDLDCSDKLSGGRMGLGLKAGYDFGQFRVYGQYQHNFKAKETAYESDSFNGKVYSVYDEEMSWKTDDITVGADYTPSFTDNFKGLVGGYLGYSHLKYTYTDKGTYPESFGFNSNGIVYGVRLGGMYSFNEHNELEFGVKAEQANYKRHTDEEGDSFKPKTTNYGAFVGYNYKF